MFISINAHKMFFNFDDIHFFVKFKNLKYILYCKTQTNDADTVYVSDIVIKHTF